MLHVYDLPVFAEIADSYVDRGNSLPLSYKELRILVELNKSAKYTPDSIKTCPSYLLQRP